MTAVIHKALFEEVTSVQQSGWIPLVELEEASIEAEGILTGDEIDVEGTNVNVNDRSPEASEIHVIQTLTQDGITELSPDSYLFVRANLSAVAGGGTVSARLAGRLNS